MHISFKLILFYFPFVYFGLLFYCFCICCNTSFVTARVRTSLAFVVFSIYINILIVVILLLFLPFGLRLAEKYKVVSIFYSKMFEILAIEKGMCQF